MSEHMQRFNSFVIKHNIKLKVLSENFHRSLNKYEQSVSVYKLQLSRDNIHYIFEFTQNIVASGVKPDMHKVLACLTKFPPGSLEEFCCDNRYDKDSVEVYLIYLAVLDEYKAVQTLFGDILEDLTELV